MKRGVQSLLKAELEAHIGYPEGSKPISDNIRNGYSEKTISTSQGEMTIQVPRDRNGTFEPIIVPKHKTMSVQLEDMVLLLYGKGMSNSDIVDFMQKTYGVNYSTSQISIITNRLLEDIKISQQHVSSVAYSDIFERRNQLTTIGQSVGTTYSISNNYFSYVLGGGLNLTLQLKENIALGAHFDASHTSNFDQFLYGFIIKYKLIKH